MEHEKTFWFGEADTCCKRLYGAVLDVVRAKMGFDAETEFMRQASSIMDAAPSTGVYVRSIHDALVGGRFDSALERARELIAYEAALLQRPMVAINSEGSTRH